MTTVVSAYYWIKSKFPVDTYVQWMRNFFSLKCNKVIFTDRKTFPVLQSIEGSHTAIYVIVEIANFVSAKPEYNDKWASMHEIDPYKSIHSTDLYKIWNNKVEFVKMAIDLNFFKSDYFVWCDIGSFRNSSRITEFKNFPVVSDLENILFLQLEPFTKEELVSPTNFDSRFHLDQRGVSVKNRIGGGIIAGDKKSWRSFHTVFYDTFEKFMEKSLYAQEQQIFAFCIINNPDLFKLVTVPNGYRYDPWFYLHDYFSN